MTDTEVLQKAIEKAITNGWIMDPREIDKWAVIGTIPPYLSVFVWFRDHTSFDADTTLEHKYKINDIIFSHDFAKAFWGDNWVKVSWTLGKKHDLYGVTLQEAEQVDQIHEWQYHLQQMVLEENPLQYLAKFLEESK